MKHNTIILFLLFCLTACSPKFYPIQDATTRTDTVYVNRVQVDSIYKHDSVFIREKNDTIYIYKEKIRERYKMLHDTTYVSHTDTLHTTVVQEVEKQFTKWQSFRIVFGDICLCAIGIILLALILWTAFKRYIKPF